VGNMFEPRAGVGQLGMGVGGVPDVAVGGVYLFASAMSIASG